MPLPLCPHCNAPARRLGLLGSRARPYVCALCRGASVVLPNAGQQIIVALSFAAAAVGFSTLLRPHGYGMLTWLLAGLVSAGVLALLVITTSHLRKALPLDPPPES